jgi:hypothetical protein
LSVSPSFTMYFLTSLLSASALPMKRRRWVSADGAGVRMRELFLDLHDRVCRMHGEVVLRGQTQALDC